MKEMPTKSLLADEEYIYIPETDDWKVQKKSGSRKLSKNDYGKEAICPICGEWKPTKYSPAELQEIDWACSDCLSKHPTEIQELEQREEMEEAPPTLPSKPTTPKDRGSKQITKFDPEFNWLLKLVDVIAKAAPEAMGEIKTLSKQHPFVTIDDAGDLAAQIWTLATEKYGIPREWLMKKLPKNANLNKLSVLECVCGHDRDWHGMGGSHKCTKCDCKSFNAKIKSSLKQAYEGGYPTEEDATYWGGGPQGTVAYEPAKHDSQTGRREGDNGEPIVICPKCKSDKVAKESSSAKCQACGTNFVPEPDRGSDDPAVNDYSQNYFWGPNDLGRSHQNQPGANGWLPAGTEDMDGPSSNVRMSSFKSFMHKQSSLNKVAHCGPCSVLKMEALHILIDLYYKDNSLFPEEVIEELSIAATELKIDNFNDILESVIEEYLEEKAEEVGDKLPKLKNLLIALKDIAPKLGKEIEVVDKQENVEKEAAKEEYPKISKPKSGYVDNGIGYTCGRCEYFNPEREKCKKVEGTIKSFGCCNFWDGEGKFKEKNKTAEKKALETDKRALTKEEAVYVQYPNVDYRCDECAFFNAEAKTCTKVDGEISPTASCNFWQPIKSKQANLKQAKAPPRLWADPNGKEFDVPSAGHGAWIKTNKDLLTQYGVNTSTVGYTWPDMISKGWTRVANEWEGSGDKFGLEVADLNNLPPYLDNLISKYYTKGKDIELGDTKGRLVTVDDPFPSIQKAVNKELMHSKQASLLDEVLDQTTQDAIASEYGVQYLIPLRFYQEAQSYGQSPDRAFRYAMQEGKREKQEIDPKKLAELVETYF